MPVLGKREFHPAGQSAATLHAADVMVYRGTSAAVMAGAGEGLLAPTTSARTMTILKHHIAFGSIRMEPVFMILGQSAATAAVLAIEEGASPQRLSYEKLRKVLEEDGQVLEYEKVI